MQVDEQVSRPVVQPTELVSEPLTPLPPDAMQPADDEDDSPDAIFLRAISEIPTQPLPTYTPREQQIGERRFFILVGIMVVSFFIGSMVGILTYPTVTVTLVPVQKSLHLTTTLPIPTRMLAPASVSRTLSAATTGHGHQDARAATGTVTLYNTQLQTISIPNGAVFTGTDGIQVALTQDAVIPPVDPTTTPPTLGQLSVSAHAVQPGASGNIAAFDLNGPCCHASVIVKNLQAFIGGRDARNYRAVAQQDLDRLTATLQASLAQALPQVFVLALGEVVIPTACHTAQSADHRAGDEATNLTIKATYTCRGIAYAQDELQQQATAVFTATRPGKPYELVGSVHTTVMRVSPFLVRVSGSWAYVFSQDYEQYLATQIAGDTPAQAKAYLLRTGVVSQATVPRSLLQDPSHIQFVILIGV